MAGRIRAYDWASTPLGPMENWPQPLRTAVSLMLGAAQPVYIAWGPELTSLYNDHYLPIVGTKHPGLGLPFAELWAEIWDEFRPLVEKTMAGDAQHFVDMPIALAGRPGVPVGYFTFSYTALHDEEGRIAGFYCAAVETTDRVQTEKALRESEERLGLAVEIGGVGHWELDLSTGELTTSALCRMNFGRPADAPFSYDDLRSSIHPADRERQQRTVAAAIEARSAFDIEYRLLTPGGELRWAEIRGRFEDGDRDRLAGVSLDITRRKQAEELQRESEERQTFLLALGDAMRSQSGASGKIDVASRLLGERLGASRVLYAEFDHARGVAEIFSGWLADGAQPFPAVLRLEDHDGPIMDDLRASRTVRIDDAGPLVDQPAYAAIAEIGVRALLSVPLVVNGELVVNLSVHQQEARHWTDDEVSLVQEVAERSWAEVVRARAEAAAREAEERYLTLFDSIDQGFCVIEMLFDEQGEPADYRFLEVSPSFERQTGIVDAAGRRMREIAPDHEDHWFRIYGEVALTGEPERFENFAQALGRWYDVYAYRVDKPEKHRVAILFSDITERKRIEGTLRESEARFREQFENANDFIFTADLDMRLTSGNPAFARALGYGIEELIGRSISEFVPPGMWEINKTMFAAKLAGDIETTRYEVEVFDADGGLMTWEINSRLARDASGAPTGIHAIARDVTERKRAEEALRESEQRFRRIADSTPTPMWVTGLDRKREFVNRAYVDFLGISYEDAVDFDWRDILHPDDHDRILAESIAGEASLEPFVLEARYCGNDEEWHWMRSTSQPRFNGQGEHTGFIGVAHDVTAAKAAQDVLRESELRLRLIFDSLDEYAIITLDRRGQVTAWNDGAERLLGYTETEAVGMDGRVIFTPEDRKADAPEREIDTALNSGRAANERWHVRKDGSRFWGSGAVLSMIEGGRGANAANGRDTGSGAPVLVKIMRDETVRMEHERHQKLLLAELQHRVRNTLGIVRSIARQSRHGHDEVEDYVAQLVGRLDALARIQVMLTRDAGAGVDLERMVKEELSIQPCDENKIVIQGPEVSLPAKSAEVLTLAVHELATNAAKYGALAHDGGRLSVTWALDRREDREWLDMEWVETGMQGMRSPAREGFGTELIERRVPYELRGEASMDYTREGLRVRIAFPLIDGASVLESGPAREVGG